MALAFALMAILPALAATATIKIDKSFVSATGSFEIEIADADRDTTILKKGTLSFDSATVNAGTLAVDTFDLKVEHSFSPSVDDYIDANMGIKSIVVKDDTRTTDRNESTNFNVVIFDAEAGLIAVQTYTTLNGKQGEVLGGSGEYDIRVHVEVSSLDYVKVKLTSVSDKVGKTVTATESGLGTGIFKVSVLASGTESQDEKADFLADLDYDKLPKIKSAPGETITAKYTDLDSSGDSEGSRTTTIVIESNEVSATVVAPSNAGSLTDTTPDLIVDFTDSDSGVKSSTIAFTIASVASSGSVASFAQSTIDTTDVTGGFRATTTLTPNASADNATTLVTWYGSANDKAGNTGRTDGNSSKSGDQNHTFVIDKEGPEWTSAGATATAGFWYDTSKSTVSIDVTKSSSTSIGIKFNNVVGDIRETIDAGTVAITDFEIDDLTIADGTILKDQTPTAVNVYADFGRWIFLTVPAMSPDSKPKITLKAGISDMVGNTTASGSVNVEDGQAPVLTVTLGDTLDDDKTKVSISSNEALGVNPQVWANDASAGWLVATVSADSVATNSWEATIDSAQELGAFSIRVKGNDTSGNVTSKGNLITKADWPTKDSYAFFSDNLMTAGVIDPADNATPEIAVPFFITLDFSTEKKEYGLDSSKDVTTTVANIVTDLDTHHTVTISKLTLDGVDVVGKLDTQDNVVFTVALLDITIGDHELKYTANDLAGNKVEDVEIDFEVKARSSYSVAMSAGWNLVSLPGSPADTAIDSVLPGTHPATDVLSFANGAWSIATRSNGAGSAWAGSLTSIDGSHAYWVNTTSSAPVKTLLALPSAGTVSTLPTVAVAAGWNLVPVIDLGQKKQDNAVDGVADRTGAAYFTSINWSVAYTYASATRAWTRITPSNGASLFNGDGAWVWATRAGTLIP